MPKPQGLDLISTEAIITMVVDKVNSDSATSGRPQLKASIREGVVIVSIGHHPIWDSGTDYRIYSESAQYQEPLEAHFAWAYEHYLSLRID